MRDRLMILVMIMLGTAFLGEMKMNPFGETFRFSLGITAYFFGMIWFRRIPILLTGFLVGSFILGFRVEMDMLFDHISLEDSLRTHLPSSFYYLFFALIIQATRLRESFENPFWVGIIGTLADLTSNYGELFVRQFMGESYPMTWKTFLILLLFALLRSFFVVGLYNIFSIRQVRALGTARQRELERLMLINSNLYEEALYLRKSMSHLEEITRKSYHLYKQLMNFKNMDCLSADALQIAENVHEVKKDSQRILAGLSKIIKQEELIPHYSILDLCGLVIRANEKYSEMIGKQIQFEYRCDISLLTNQVYALLSVLNNLVSNAVEAIPDKGFVKLKAELKNEEIVFSVMDSGFGIPLAEREWVFQPGYTTKYDAEGNPSTGIGLSHAKDIVQSLNGTLSFCDCEKCTCFEIRIPTNQLMKSKDF